MAVKIIKYGSLAREPVCYSICDNCGCHFTFARRDARAVIGSLSKKRYFIIKCPTTACDSTLEALDEEFRHYDFIKSGEPS